MRPPFNGFSLLSKKLANQVVQFIVFDHVSEELTAFIVIADQA